MSRYIGQQFGNYRLVSLQGKGGFAEVYLGEHIHLHSKAAIKILLTQLTKKDREGFLEEALTLVNLNHPNIIRLLDFGTNSEDQPFLVMDFAPNGSLRQRHPKGTLVPTRTVIDYVKQIASALQYAHNEGLVHRDIKPENILIGKRQELLLTDFGIALVAESSMSQSIQEVAGTAAYMAPEQFQGKPRPASDQYALAIMAYEWLVGERPFSGSFMDVASQHMLASPPPIQGRTPEITAAIEQVIMIALAKEYKLRFPSVEAFAMALEQAYHEEMPTLLKGPQTGPSLGFTPLPGVPTNPTPYPSYPPGSYSLQTPSGQTPNFTPTPSNPGFTPTPSGPGFVQNPSHPGFTPTPSGPGFTPTPSNSGFVANPSNPSFTPAPGNQDPTVASGHPGPASLPSNPSYTSQTASTAVPLPTVHASTTPSLHTDATESNVRVQEAVPANPPQQQHGIKRRTVLIGIGAAIVAAAGAGITVSLANNTSHGTGNTTQRNTGNTTQTVPPKLQPTSQVTAMAMFGQDPQHTHFIPQEHTLTTGNVNQLQLKWKRATDGALSLSSATVVNSVVYIGSHDGNLYALKAKDRDGSILWKKPLGDVGFSTPAVTDTTIYIGSTDTHIYAIDIATHKIKWRFATGGAVLSSPTVANGVVYVGSEDTKVYALDAQNGTVFWTYATGGRIHGSPALNKDTLYIGSFDNYLHAIDINTGTKRWAYKAGAEINSSPVVSGNTVTFGSWDNSLHNVDIERGVQNWEYATGGFINSSPAFADGIFYVGSKDSTLYAISADYEVKWKQTVQAEIASSPTVANGVVYVGSWDGNLYAFDAQKGDILWHYQTQNGIESSPAVVDGIVYVGSRDNSLYAFHLPGS